MDKVYICFTKNNEVNTRDIRVKDVAKVWCKNKEIINKINNIEIVKIKEAPSRRYVMTALKVISIIDEKIPNIELVNIGITEFIISYKKMKHTNTIWSLTKIVFISAIVFCGGAFAIMAYENDVSISGIFEGVNEWLNNVKNGVFIEKIAYSIGLITGVVIFYICFGRRSSVKDPTPLEVKMRLYEDEINTAIIDDSERQGKIDDVD